MTDTISSGIRRLDDVLGGGLPANGIALIAGSPGTGKTILAQHYVFHNSTDERPALYCSTVSEPLDKMLRYGQSLQLFDASRVGSSVFFEDLGAVVSDGGLDAVLDRLEVLLREHRPSVIAIDSFKALSAFAPDDASYRRFLHGLAGRLSAIATSAFFLGEYTSTEMGVSAEFAVADGVIRLALNKTGPRATRLLDLLHDGYWRGASTLVAGPTGSGKTLMGLHFIFGGLAAGEPGIFATLQEST